MFTAFILGISTAITPCTIAIIPIFLYRFGIWGNKDKKVLARELGLALLGFVLSLLAVGLAYDSILNSDFSEVFKLVLGTGLIIVGVLQLVHRFNLSFLQNSTNSFFLGALFPWTISLSPCVVPIFTGFLVSELEAGLTLKFILFGIGMLTPAVLVSIIGNKLFEIMKKGSKAFRVVEKLSGLLIIFSGIYLNFQVLDLREYDIVIASIIFLIMILVTAYITFVQNGNFTVARLIMFVAVLILWAVFSFNCYNEVGHTSDFDAMKYTDEVVACGVEKECEVCKRCAILFSIAALVGSSGYVLSTTRYDKKIRLPRIVIKA